MNNFPEQTRNQVSIQVQQCSSKLKYVNVKLIKKTREELSA